MSLRDTDLIKDIREVGAEVGGTPTLKQYREHGSHSASTLYDRFGSWSEALEAAGYESREPDSEVSKEQLLTELQRVADELGKTPSTREMNEHGQHWGSTYRRKFDSWNNAIEAAELKPAVESLRRSESLSEEDLLAELERVADERGTRPTFQDMEEVGRHSARTYVRRFGSWNEAVEAAGFEPVSQQERISEAELIADLHRLEQELGTQPVSTDVIEYGSHALATYQRRFGSWSAALEAAFGDEEDSGET